ncbi:hypothetical protein [Dactylosporangium darangshiense]|uniref:Uncharacterized protein n=1 Tax=Dactylosporangium darangshiense TaxID=579108 RepID=A0ABP8DHP8_9ACTN
MLAEQLSRQDVPPILQKIDFHTLTALLTAERLRPQILPVLRKALGKTDYERDIDEIADEVRSKFSLTEETLVAECDAQLAGRPFGDLGSRRTLTFSALGTTWFVTCLNNQYGVLAAERFVAGAQILIVELAPAILCSWLRTSTSTCSWARRWATPETSSSNPTTRR